MQITNPDAMMFAWSRKKKGLPGSQAITFDVIAGKVFEVDVKIKCDE